MSNLRLLLVAIAATIMSGSFALADTAQSPAAQATPSPANNDPDAIVCRTGAPPTGSRLGAQRVCHTQKQWDQLQQDTAREVGIMQGGSGTPLGGGGGK